MPGIEQRQKASRYRTEFDDDDGGAALLAAQLGPPAICCVFLIPDEDEATVEEVETITTEREKVIGAFRALNLNVEAYSTKRKIYCKLSAPDTMLRFEAESRQLRLRLREDHGGALCKFSQELDDKDAFDKALDGFALFSSSNQLFLIKSVLFSNPGGNDDNVKAIDFEALVEQKVMDGGGLFGLHHDRMRLKLLNEWARAFSKPQPLELIREYFGVKIALFYTWMGFYNTMLWIPGLVGLALFISQIFTYPETKSFDNPFVPIYACVAAIWASMFCQLWKALENTRKYQWDTLKFESLEETRDAFMQNELTEMDTHINEVTGEADDYYFDDGTYLPPTGRAKLQLITYAVILLINVTTILSSIFIWKNVAFPLLEPDNITVGAVVFAVTTTLIALFIDAIMDGIAELEIVGVRPLMFHTMTQWMHKLVDQENWKTDTEHEDAIIMKTFYFKMASKYFSLFFVAFAVNYVPLTDDFFRCPEWQCMPLLQVVFVTTVTLEIVYSLVVSHVFPVVNKYLDSLADNSALKDAAAVKAHKTPMEEQEEWLEPTPVIDLYKDKVYQFGYVAMFGVAFPMVTFLCLIFNLVDMRSRASTLLTKNKRPDPKVAADIGPYQQVLEVFATLAIITNAAICGVTSYGLYFFFPHMNLTQAMWAVVVLEHLLFMVRILVVNMIPEEPADAKLEYQTSQDRKTKLLTQWGIVEPEDEE